MARKPCRGRVVFLVGWREPTGVAAACVAGPCGDGGDYLFILISSVALEFNVPR